MNAPASRWRSTALAAQAQLRHGRQLRAHLAAHHAGLFELVRESRTPGLGSQLMLQTIFGLSGSTSSSIASYGFIDCTGVYGQQRMDIVRPVRIRQVLKDYRSRDYQIALLGV